MTTSPELSACLIVRNEQAKLGRCLASLAGVVDEIVVVDTGSTDATIEIARSHGARVVEQPWADDFASARNRALDEAAGRWVLSLDADEWIRPGAGSLVRAAIAEPGAVGFRIGLSNHLDGGRRDEERLTRLFLRRPDVRWRGRIHEQVTEDLAALVARDGLRWGEVRAIVLEHDGYLGATMTERGKRERNLRLLDRAVAEAPDDVYLRAKLAGELGVGAGAEHRRRVVDALVALPSEALRGLPWAEEALLNAGLSAVAEAAPHVGLRAIGACRAAFGGHPALALAEGRVLVALGRYDDALAAVEAVEQAEPRGPAFDHEALALELELCAAEALRGSGDLERSFERLVALRQARPDAPQPVHALVRLALEIGDARAALSLGLARLREHANDPICLCLCADAAERLGDRSTASRWRAMAAGA